MRDQPLDWSNGLPPIETLCSEGVLRGVMIYWLQKQKEIPVIEPEYSTMGDPEYSIWIASVSAKIVMAKLTPQEMLMLASQTSLSDFMKVLIGQALQEIDAERHQNPDGFRTEMMLDAGLDKWREVAIGNRILKEIMEGPKR